jgi:RHS repeat-associated protein
VRALTDPNGNIVQTYQADEFGVPALVQGASSQPFGYAGQQTDAESGFQYLRARMYDPSTGRFLQRGRVADRLAWQGSSLPVARSNGKPRSARFRRLAGSRRIRLLLPNQRPGPGA